MKNWLIHILLAVLLDAVLGDPRRLPHPVRGLGRLAGGLEKILLKPGLAPGRVRRAGMAAWLLTVGGALAAGGIVLWLGALVHPVFYDGVSVILIYFCLSAQDLIRHGLRVARRLENGNLKGARRACGLMVSRQTGSLDRQGLIRATLESLAENLSDGVMAPLVWAAIIGPLGAVFYRAVNTLDAMFGYQNQKYRDFGRFAARADDWASYVPARLSAALTVLAAFLNGLNGLQALLTLFRDGRKNPSPNAGLNEAALAGALGVRLGGPSSYFGRTKSKPWIGTGGLPLDTGHIRRAARLLLTAYGLLLFFIAGLALI